MNDGESYLDHDLFSRQDELGRALETLSVTDPVFWQLAQEASRGRIQARPADSNVTAFPVDTVGPVARRALEKFLGPRGGGRPGLEDDSFSADSPRFVGLAAQLIRTWTGLALDLERGQPQWDQDQYRAMLYERSSLQLMFDRNPGLAPRLHLLLNPWDERFRQATVVGSLPQWGFIDSDARLLPLSEVAWWWFRYPRYWSKLETPVVGDYWDADGIPREEEARRFLESWERRQN